MGNLLFLVITVSIAILAIAVVTIYSIIYRRAINKRLHEPQGSKQMWSPIKVCIVTIITALVVFGIIASIIAVHNPSVNTDGAYAKIYQPENMGNGYSSMYSIDKNSGYTKHVERIGNVKYTYYISNEDYDSCHPAFLIYAEQIGNDKTSYYDADCSFQTMDGKEFYSVSASEGKNEQYVCFVGNAPINCKISCIVEYYNQKKASMNFDELYANNRALTFVLSNHE